ncbi:transmembrane protein 53-like [Mercenaria mercenaria]|uniref:transmembrane protein 53-like n=1 Tax=Mercenaria mercenaria TaxID=6596 RepID=UPI00234EEB74|nr:transmembrane protein 53-like [Mercenaria mercenaria]
MEDDDLEYDITFPTPLPADTLADEEDALSGKKEPVVILLGWLGCTEKYLSKYGQIYDERGCITIRYTSPRDTAFFKVEQLKDTACKLLDLLEDYSITENPILFHIFSNNGSFVYANIVEVLTSGDKRYQNLNVCGVVIDSAPGKPRFKNAAVAYGTSLNVNPVLRYIMMFCLWLYLAFTGVISSLAVKFYPKIKEKSNHFLWDKMASDPTRWPMLFLYSVVDKIILAEDIEDMISRRRALGVHVSAMCWDDTDHVSHLRKHPEQYAEACGDFLISCLGYDQDIERHSDQETLETNQDYLLAKKQ